MEKQPKKHILDVVPLTRIPLTRNQSFCYLSEEKLPPGSLVSIPLFHRQTEGIVLGSHPDFKRLGNIQLKKINRIIQENFLTTQQLELARFISDYYISPLGIVMKNFVPTRAKARSISYPVSSILYKKKEIKLTKQQQTAVDEITNIFSKFKIQNSKFLLYGPSSSGKTEVYIHSILKFREKNQDLQFLILVPEKTLTPQALERYGAYFNPEEIVLLTSDASKGQYYSAWQKIRSGEAKIIIGTRMAVFAPFRNLGLIVIDEEQDDSFKQYDMNPRYDARMVAEKLSEIFRCPLVRGSATPSIESYFKATKKLYKLLELPELNIQDIPPRRDPAKAVAKYQMPSTILVDMKKERWINLSLRQAGNFSCISKKLQSEIAYALKHNRQIILFINRQGMSTFSVCENCKNILRCPKCDRALIYNNAGIYKCPHCAYKTSPIPQCSKCQSISFKNVGLGTQKVEKEIENLFPGTKILRADKETTKKSGSQNKIYADFSQKKASILIGTQMISKGWDLRNVSLIGIIDTDNLFSMPDFYTSEKAFRHILQISGRTSRFGTDFPGTVIIQTFHPENELIRLASVRDFTSFFGQINKERKELSLPPFGKIIKLVFQDYSIKKTQAETERAYKIFKSISDVKATEPHDSFVPKIRGKFRRQIIVKYKGKLPTVLVKELKKLGSGWIIDVDPISTT